MGMVGTSSGNCGPPPFPNQIFACTYNQINSNLNSFIDASFLNWLFFADFSSLFTNAFL